MTATAQPRVRAAAATAATAAVPRPDAPRLPDGPERNRPPLRVVRPEEAARRSRRRRARLVAVSSVLLVGLSLFGVVVAHVVLTQNQFELQKVKRQAAEEQARYERLRLQVAELESPSRIVAAAQERLGMVPPPSVKYLTPKADAAAPAIPPGAAGTRPAGAGMQAAAGDTADDGADGEEAMNDWSTVKRQLGSRP